jgi:hypothetical protein
MAQFISTRNSLQCRSHHQKLEEKYTHANKIIALFKNHFNKTLYKKFMEQLDAFCHEKNLESITRYSFPEKIMQDKQVQTDIQDIASDLVVVSPNLVVVQNKTNPQASQQPHYAQSPLYYPPHLYSSMDAAFQTSPQHYPISHLGWWGGYPNTRF